MSSATKLKSAAFRAAPGVYGRLQEAWTAHQIKKITRTIVAQHGLVIQAGPFAGLRYLPQAAGSSLLPKLLGCYEAELAGAIAEILNRDYQQVIDVGCAEGYYAVGLASRLTRAQVFAFDIDPRARELCGMIAELNGVSERVHISGECSFEDLRKLIGDRTLVVCDCEGCELQLLDPDSVPKLKTCDFLIELHDVVNPSISKTIVQRFQETHHVSLISQAERDIDAIAALDGMGTSAKRIAVAEFRDAEMQWAFLTAKN